MKFLSIFLIFISTHLLASECFEKRIYTSNQIMNVDCTTNFEGEAFNHFIMWENSMYLTIDYVVCPNRDYYIATVTHMPTQLLKTFKCDGEIKVSAPR